MPVIGLLQRCSRLCLKPHAEVLRHASCYWAVPPSFSCQLDTAQSRLISAMRLSRSDRPVAMSVESSLDCWLMCEDPAHCEQCCISKVDQGPGQLVKHEPVSKAVSSIPLWFLLGSLPPPFFFLSDRLWTGSVSWNRPFLPQAVFLFMVFTIAIESKLEHACQGQGCVLYSGAQSCSLPISTSGPVKNGRCWWGEGRANSAKIITWDWEKSAEAW